MLLSQPGFGGGPSEISILRPPSTNWPGLWDTITSNGELILRGAGLISGVVGQITDNQRARAVNEFRASSFRQASAGFQDQAASLFNFSIGQGHLAIRESERKASFAEFDRDLQLIQAHGMEELRSRDIYALERKNDAELSQLLVQGRRGASFGSGVSGMLQQMIGQQVFEETTARMQKDLEYAKDVAIAQKQQYQAIRAKEEGQEQKWLIDGRAALDVHRSQMQARQQLANALDLEYQIENQGMFDGVLDQLVRHLPGFIATAYPNTDLGKQLKPYKTGTVIMGPMIPTSR